MTHNNIHHGSTRILVIKCLNDEDIMIFYCETSHRTVIDILRHNQEIFEKENNNKEIE